MVEERLTIQPQRENSERGGQRLLRRAFRVHPSHQGGQGLAPPLRDLVQRVPELRLQRHAGPVPGEAEATLDEAQAYSPSVAPGSVISAGCTQRSKSSGLTKPSASAASRSVMFSASAFLP